MQIELLMILWILDSVEKLKYKIYKINNKTQALKREPSNKDKLMASQNQTYVLQQLLYCLKLKMGDVQSTFDTTNK